MKCSEKIEEIKKVFELYHKERDEYDEREFDSIDAMMRIEEIIKK